MFIELSTGYIHSNDLHQAREHSFIQKAGILVEVQQGVKCLKIGKRQAFDDYLETGFTGNGATCQDHDQ